MTRIVFDFDETKATQVIGVWAKRCGGLFDYYIAMKALYALDRAALLKWEQPVVGGDYRMLPWGPANQQALDATKVGRQGFFAVCFERVGNEIRIKMDPEVSELSQDELKLAEKVCDEWKGLSFREAHEKAASFPECKGIDAVVWIPVEAILEGGGKSKKAIAVIAREASIRREFSRQPCS